MDINMNRRQRQPVIHSHVLYEIFECLNLSELKRARLVCRQWCKASRYRLKSISGVGLGNHHMLKGYLRAFGGPRHYKSDFSYMSRDRMQAKLNLFAAEKVKFTRRTPVSQLKLLPTTYEEYMRFIWTDALYKISETWISMNTKKLDAVLRKFTEGITSFFIGWDEEELKIRVEDILLRPEFSNLVDFRLLLPFQISENSDVSLRFRGLKELHVGINCGKDLVKYILKNCYTLKRLSIGFNFPFLQNTDNSNPETISMNFMDGVFEAFEENVILRETVTSFELHLAIEERINGEIPEVLPDDWEIGWSFLPLFSSELLFQKLMNLKLRLTDGHFSVDLTGKLDGQLLHFLESQKDSMRTLTIPGLPLGVDLESVEFQLPIMRELEELSVNANIYTNFYKTLHRLPKLKTVNLFSLLWRRVEDIGPVFVKLEECFASNLTPCPSVEKLDLTKLALPSLQILTGMNRLFPNVKTLMVRIEDPAELQALWNLWPKLRSLYIEVRLFHFMLGKRKEEPLAPFNAAIVGLSTEDYKTLYSSGQEFDTVNITADCNLPSIRNLTELTYLKIYPGPRFQAYVTNISLVLGILYLKNLHELCLEGHITIDCAQYVIKGLPLLKRWNFKSFHLNRDPPPRKQPYPTFVIPGKEHLYPWIISTENENRIEPVYPSEVDLSRYRYREEKYSYGHRLRSAQKSGRNGKSLQCGTLFLQYRKVFLLVPTALFLVMSIFTLFLCKIQLFIVSLYANVTQKANDINLTLTFYICIMV